MWDIDTPALTTRLRGMVVHAGHLKAADARPAFRHVRRLGAQPDQRADRNPGRAHDADGRVQLPGFYDRVTSLTDAQRAQWDALGFDEAAFLAEIGLTAPAGERGCPALERLWARPTADINGIWGGYAGPGRKTVIAAEAGAKVVVPAGAGPGSRTRYSTRSSASCTERLPPGATRRVRAAQRGAGDRGEHRLPAGCAPRWRPWARNTASRRC